MALQKQERSSELDSDYEKVKFAIGLSLEGKIHRISNRKPSNFGGEVRYIEVDTNDGRKVSFGLSGFKLEVFEENDYREGDAFAVEVEKRETGDGTKSYGFPVFSYDPDDRVNRVPADRATVGSAVDDNPPF